MVYPRFNLSGLMACPDCDLLLKKASPVTGHKIKCPRCGTVIRSIVNDSITKALAASLTGLLLYLPAMMEPIMTFCIAGMTGSGNVINAFFSLVGNGYYFVGGMVLLTSILFPLLKLFFLFLVSFSLKFNCFKSRLPGWFRTYQHLSEWGMVEVYMLGILITIIKMHGMAEIDYNIGFLCFFLLVFITTASSVMVDEEAFWEKMEPAPSPDVKDKDDPIMSPLPLTARSAGIIHCRECSKLVYEQPVSKGETALCPRCNAALKGLVRFEDNPDHKRAKLVVPTEKGQEALDQLEKIQMVWSNAISKKLSTVELKRVVHTMKALSKKI